MIHLDLVDNALRETFPASSDLISLEYVRVDARDEATLVVTMRIIRWERGPGDEHRMIQDVLEQELEVRVGRLDLAMVARLRDYAAALVAVAARALLHPSAGTLLPADLADWSALSLKRATTQDDFVAALSVPSRLGKYLG